ncbi:MAG: nucleotidyl transferase AbiEii/AbiGii toxin family protein [Candidatus Binataceae bacterium]
MPFSEAYRQQAALVVRVLPEVAREDCFALKGGTGINLFIRDMPRLSVDIDLTYLPVQGRAPSLAAIDAAMKRVEQRIRKSIRRSRTTLGVLRSEGIATKVIVRAEGVQIKIEVTPVLRGSVYPTELRAVSSKVEETFGFAEVRVLSFPDIYAGKIMAALDRQHPRDLFDVRHLLQNEGIDDSLRRAFIVYLVSHDRPMFEVLAGTRRDISKEFERGFEGMADEPVSLHELIEAREKMVDLVVGRMPEEHRRFLILFEKGEPDWSLLGLPEAAELPAVKWREKNLAGLSQKKRAELVSRLEAVLVQSRK